MNMNAIIPLEPGYYYHIYNRGNNSERIFYQERNYQYFLDKYKHYLTLYVQTLAFCLLPNHFHFLVKIRPLQVQDSVADLVSDQFRKLFICYSMAINKQEGRTGSLFQKNFRRKKILDKTYLLNAIYYIHHNPSRHGFREDTDGYAWSSYRSYVQGGDGLVDYHELAELFGDLGSYIQFHRQTLTRKDEEKWVIEA